MDFIRVPKLRQMLSGSIKSVFFYLLTERLGALRLNLVSLQVKCNKNENNVFMRRLSFFFQIPPFRGQQSWQWFSILPESTSAWQTLDKSEESTCSGLQYVSAVRFIAGWSDIDSTDADSWNEFWTKMSAVKWKQFSISRMQELFIPHQIVLDRMQDWQ